METLATVLGVGFIFVLPQVIGFAAARLGRRLPASVWPLVAAATVAVLWAISVITDHRAAERAHAAGRFYCGTPQASFNSAAPFLLAFHFVVGSILGTLDRRARRS